MATAKKSFGLMLLLIGIALAAIGASMLLLPGQYRATVRIEIGSPVETSPSSSDASVYDPYFIQTEFSRMQSEMVLGNAVTNLHLGEIWGDKYNKGRPLPTADAIARIKQGMEIKPERNTRIIDVSFTSSDPHEAANVANAVVGAYGAYRIQQWRTNSAVGVQALEDSYNEEHKKIDAEANALDQLRKQLNIPTPEPADDILKTNYPTYQQKKRELQREIDLQKLLQAKITNEKVNQQLSKTPVPSPIQIVDAAQTPKYPVKPNRYLGATLFAIGLLMSGLGAWRVKRP